MLKIRLPFGFRTVQLDDLYTMHSGKIRVKFDHDLLVIQLINVEGLTFNKVKNGCVIISYVVTDISKHMANMKAINAVLCEIMTNRIQAKYRDWSVVPDVIERHTIEELDF